MVIQENHLVLRKCILAVQVFRTLGQHFTLNLFKIHTTNLPVHLHYVIMYISVCSCFGSLPNTQAFHKRFDTASGHLKKCSALLISLHRNANWNFNEVLLYTIRMIKIWKDYTKYWQENEGTGTLKVNHILVQSFVQLFGKCLLMATQSSILAYGKSHGQRNMVGP